MSDPWVLGTQKWLNTNYQSVPGWVMVPETGQTGWPTMYGLVRALQHELGISPLSESFGPATLAALSALGNIGPDTENKYIIRIVQGGMYCKGYNGGNGILDGVYSDTTINGVKDMRADIGLSVGDGTLSPKLFKALLTMDAYVLIAGGSAPVREIQRALNARYLARQDFYVVPADGIYSRDVQQGLMLAIQYELGMSDGVANGVFGPTTQTMLAAQANYGLGDSDAASGKYLIHLYQAALLFNGYATAFSGSFTADTQSKTQSFQTFCMLSSSGRSDFRTWASLLVSTGDTSRPGTAADTIREITAERAATLLANGYTTIGRYLSNQQDLPNALDKDIKPGELNEIFGAGLKVFPIFQEGGINSSYFNYAKGYQAAQRAHDKASGYRFNAGTVIYFAVDFDALESEVLSNVVPHFKGIRDGMQSLSSPYRVGVYGSRNTCSIVSNEGLAVFSFVSGMSTGFSGNLGYPLPKNWAFDQILEYEIGSGDGWVNIDKNIQSGRDAGQSSIPPIRETLSDTVSARGSVKNYTRQRYYRANAQIQVKTFYQQNPNANDHTQQLRVGLINDAGEQVAVISCPFPDQGKTFNFGNPAGRYSLAVRYAPGVQMGADAVNWEADIIY